MAVTAAKPQPSVPVNSIADIAELCAKNRDIKLKTLVATGENDIGSNPRMSKLMHERIKGSRLHIFPKLRHNLLFEAPKQVSGLVRDFLQS